MLEPKKRKEIAIESGRRGGLRTAQRLSKAQLAARGRKAALVRWAKKDKPAA